jgi:hypothetical protein
MCKRKQTIIFILAAVALFPVISGCVDPGAAGSTVRFSDQFEYTPASPWAPLNGWSSTRIGPVPWQIVTGGVTGNALRFPPASGLSGLINSYSNTNYKVSVRVMVAADTSAGTGWPIYVLARATDENNFYGVGIYCDSVNCYLELTRSVGISSTRIASESFKTGHFDNGIYYTLTITVNGNSIIGACSGGGDSATVSGTANDFASGRPGVLVWTNPGTYDVLFDDFTVTDF